MDLSGKMDQLDLNSEMRRLRLDPREGERVFEIVPKHFGRMFLPVALFSTLTLIFIVGLIALANSPLGTSTVYITVTSVMAIIYLFASIYLLTAWYCYQYSALLFTNFRIIDVEYRNIVTRLIRELDIHGVQNANGEVVSPLQRFFNYGKLTIDRIGYDPIVINNVPYPQVVAEQTLHFHNLMAHGGIDTAHNFLATSLSDDTTPELEETIKKAETLAQAKTEPSPTTPIGARGNEAKTETDQSKQKVVFEAPSDKIGNLLKQLPAKDEPTVHYLPPKDTFEVEATILEEDTDPTIDRLGKEGAEKIHTKDEDQI